MPITIDGTLADRFNEAFEYKAGELYWKINPNKSKKHIGKLAGYKKSTTEYGVVMLDKKSYCLHKVIFCMNHGWMPEVVDHINGDKKDHRLENLRAATHVTNNYNKTVQKNNKLGLKNISYHSKNKKYWVQLTQNRKKIYSQMFDDLELAELVAIMARDKYHGQFAKYGNLMTAEQAKEFVLTLP